MFFCTKKLLVPAAPATTAHEVAACEESAEAEQALSEKGETQQNDWILIYTLSHFELDWTQSKQSTKSQPTYEGANHASV